MKFAELVDEVKADVRKERAAAAKAIIREKVLEIERARHVLSTLERQFQELCNDDVDNLVPVKLSAAFCQAAR